MRSSSGRLFTVPRRPTIRDGQLFFKILNDPDTLADLEGRPDIPYMQAEGFQYVTGDVYRELTGRDLWQEMREAPLPLTDPEGEEFDFDDEREMLRRYPRLAASGRG
jgi:hypothetical protein